MFTSKYNVVQDYTNDAEMKHTDKDISGTNFPSNHKKMYGFTLKKPFI